MEQKLGDLIFINPRMQLKRGVIARKIAMDDLVPFSRDIASYSYSKYTGGTKFQNGDTLLARITPCLENGKTAFVNMLNDDEVAFGSTEYWILRPKDARILPYYLYYLSVSPNFRKMMIKSMTGTSGRQRVPRNVVEEFSFNLPSLEIQQKAAHSLKIIDDKIALNNKINANLLKLAKGIYYHALALNETEEAKLSDFATIVMGQSPSSKTYNEEKKGTALLNGATDFRNGIHPSKWTTDPKKIVSNGAYVFGVRATIGLTTKVFQQYAIGRGTGSAIPKNNIDDEFLYFVLNDMFNYFRQTGTGSVYINISKQNFNNYTFAKPSDQVLLKFHQRVKPIMDYVYLNTQENNNLIKVRNNLLNKLF